MSETTVTLARDKYAEYLRAIAPDLDLASLLAVIAVEAGGSGIQDGRPVIRFEVHKFWDLFAKNHADKFAKHFRYDARERWKQHYVNADPSAPAWIAIHSGGSRQQANEWLAFSVACAFDPSATPFAIQSCSWGAGQLMGFHYKRLGYATPQEMMTAAYDSNAQIRMLVEFIRGDYNLLQALKNRSWAAFALHYNGSGQVPLYSGLLSSAYLLATKLV